MFDQSDPILPFDLLKHLNDGRSDVAGYDGGLRYPVTAPTDHFGKDESEEKRESIGLEGVQHQTPLIGKTSVLQIMVFQHSFGLLAWWLVRVRPHLSSQRRMTFSDKMGPS